MTSIKIKSIHKSYLGKKVLEDVSMDFGNGICFCLLGKNGVGKSTLLNIIGDLILPDSGDIIINKMYYKNNYVEIKKNLGFLPENLPIIEELTALQFLNLIGKLHSINKYELKDRIDSLVEIFFEGDMSNNKLISQYSYGMKMKISFCASVIHKPDILILDEPFKGWDPVSVNCLIDFINNYQNEKRIIILSSHDLNYVERVATHIGVLSDKKIVFNSTLTMFKQIANNKIDDSLLKILNYQKIDSKGISWIYD